MHKYTIDELLEMDKKQFDALRNRYWDAANIIDTQSRRSTNNFLSYESRDLIKASLQAAAVVYVGRRISKAIEKFASKPRVKK